MASCAVAGCVLLAGCMPVAIPDLPDHTPARWTSTPPEAGTPVDLQQWWKALGDPTLDALVAEAVNSNLDLRQATLRLQAARMVAGTWRSGFLPTIDATARPTQDASARDSYYQTGIEAAWEPGLFGSADSARILALASAGNAESLRNAAQVAVVAGVVRSYLDLAVAQAQLDLRTQEEGLDAGAERMVATRLRLHLAEPGEQERVRARHAASRAGVAQMTEAAGSAARTLALLLGRDAPDPAWQGIRTLPQLGAFGVQQVPADLLRHRPEVALAEADVLRAAGEHGQARAALYPRLRWGGSIVYSYNITQNARVHTDSSPSFGPYIDIPLLDWGQRRMREQAGQKELEAALLGYRKAVLESIAEVEGALAGLDRQQASITALHAATEAADMQVKQQSRRVALGLSSDFDGLDLQRSALATRADLVGAQGMRLLAFVALYRALGGASPPPMEPVE
ncbi:TolC family protein [Stenotrophomonas sp. 24(2023)]|uniref:TolC family protein n=1 Tax=Stenotrophomonas sp. 24(2023) TaxID=3068324 RepID=UPI0027E193A7|nr:TolC family protein [Stenotrophomonas sp. 24(2023)]WMJ71503.1 TolC family protein [Stenotrophomonas sp. 24(2023)]